MVVTHLPTQINKCNLQTIRGLKKREISQLSGAEAGGLQVSCPKLQLSVLTVSQAGDAPGC